MESLRKEAQQLGSGNDIRQQLEGEGSLLDHLRQQQDGNEPKP